MEGGADVGEGEEPVSGAHKEKQLQSTEPGPNST